MVMKNNASAVYPRGCGERRNRVNFPCYQLGLSPRVRGTRNTRHGLHVLNRFIPAGAGNAFNSCSSLVPRSVYPRGCGERALELPETASRPGLSPRVRGTLAHVKRPLRLTRFIPAGAGNAPKLARLPSVSAVYPRGCGERPCGGSALRCPSGLSPRVRGTREIAMGPRAMERFIPAGAGNARSCSASITFSSVYPRGCGERSLNFLRAAPAPGLSPRVRGTQVLSIYISRSLRFIPAGAGNAT